MLLLGLLFGRLGELGWFVFWVLLCFVGLGVVVLELVG